MSDRTPTDTTNLDRYGHEPLAWSRPHDRMAAGDLGPMGQGLLGTVRPDGRPHAASLGVVWFDGDFYFTSGLGTRKSRNLATNPACTLFVPIPGIDMHFEGTAERVRDRAALEPVVALFAGGGWPAELSENGDAIAAPFSAPSAGPGPWPVWRFRYEVAFGVANEEPHGATRWRFND
jgi:hypothetical protein